MIAPPSPTGSLRIAYFGMRCAFSIPPLSALIERGHEIAAVILPGAPFGPPIGPQLTIQAIRFPLANQPGDNIETLAARSGAQVLNVNDLSHPDAIAAIAQLRPDVIVAACFPVLIPPAILEIPRLGSLNVHPSLLPHGRGPEPIFWTFRLGERETGVSIHLMDCRFDTGPILLQARIEVPSGIRLPQLEQQLADLGGVMLVRAIEDLASGRAVQIPQDDTLATHAPLISPEDYEIPTNLPAKWAYNFVRAVAPTTDLLRVVVEGTHERIPVIDAVENDEVAEVDAPYQMVENRLVARFHPGSVTFILPSVRKIPY
jgi:methionyl-tRNA formyltransferase